jgi:serine/threonine-protein kinase
MSEFSDRSNENVDPASTSLRAEVRRRFLAALEQSRHGGPAPDLDSFLQSLPEEERASFREELERERSRSDAPTVPEAPALDTAAEASAGENAIYEQPTVPHATIDAVPSARAGAPATQERNPGAVTADAGPGQRATMSAPRERDAIPQQVAGYEILGMLGQGAMGVVYRARQPGLKRIVALKMILSGDLAGETELIRFRGEAESLAQLHHPNIVQIYEVGEDAGRPYFSLEYVDGGSLTRKIDGTPQPPRDAARTVRLLASAMHAAHRRGVIHRDLKPANVLLTADGTPKISDFGLAKRLEEDSAHTRTGSILGTPSYMAPEQAEGRTHDIGPRSDQYSLGAILYELLTGRAPFKAGSVLDTLEQVRTQEPVAPVRFAPSVPRDLETICLKCLQKDPARRYPDAGELADDLGRFLDGLPIKARPVSATERAWRWCRRNPKVAVLSALVVVAVLIWAATSSALAVVINRQKDNTDQARIEADRNADRAEKNAQVALANEKKANDNAKIAEQNAEQAKQNALRAEKNAQTARTKHQLAVQHMTDLASKLQKRMRARRMSSEAAPEMRAVRDDLLNLLRDKMVAMARDIEGADVTYFGMIAAHQQLGDLLQKIGQGQEALTQFRKGYDLAKKLVAANPKKDNDKVRANVGPMVIRLGDMALELQGNARTARERYQEAYDIQKDVAEHPKSNDYTAVDNKRILSHYNIRLGKAELALGDPAAAQRHFEEALSFRQFWVDKQPKSIEAESYLTEAYLWLGVSSWRAGDAKATKKHFEQCLRMVEALDKRFPKSFDFKGDLAEIHGHYGDAQLRLGLLDEAAKSYQKSHACLQQVLKHDPDDTSRQPLVALIHERLAALEKTRAAAVKGYQEALEIYEELLRIEPNNLTWRGAYALALARAGKVEQATKAAADLCQRAPKSGELLLQAARAYAVCAAATADAKPKRVWMEKSLAALEGVAKTGWKDVQMIETDPDLVSVRSEAAYQNLLTRIKKGA